jgi:hypothetical protein
MIPSIKLCESVFVVKVGCLLLRSTSQRFETVNGTESDTI